MNTPEPVQAALPRAHVLSYITVTDSPTRVRVVASRGMWAVALLNLALFGLSVAWIAEVVSQIWVGGVPAGMLPVLQQLEAFLRDGPVILLAVPVITLGLALIQLIVAGPVRRGRVGPSRFAAFSLMPMILVLGLTAAFMVALGLLEGFGLFYEPRSRPEMLLLIVPAAVIVLILLLMLDLRSYLRWIVRNPIAEKPPVKFLPVAKAVVTAGAPPPGPLKRAL